jgi:putative redox protein
MQSVKTTWVEDMSFSSAIGDHRITMDSADEFGGKNKGPAPKPILLASLGGCTGMDVVSLMKKMRIDVDAFAITAQAEAAPDHPKTYTRIHLIYEFRGKNLPHDKLKKAVDLSQERYCSVSAMLKRAANLTYEIKITE